MAEPTFSWTQLATAGGANPTLSPPEEPSFELLAGRYRVVRPLMVGGFGRVVEAKDEMVGDAVAIKFLRAVSDEQLDRVLREVTALRWLRLPGVVRLRDDGLAGDEYFMVMDLIDGLPFPGRAGRVPWENLEGPTLDLLEILARVHMAGVVHRDLKPGNVLVAGGRPVVLDFGIAWGAALSLDGERGPGGGTPLYLAPEQIRGKSCDGRTDLYSVGVMLYEALAGAGPHGTGHYTEVLRRRLATRPLPLAELAPEVPEPVCALVDAMLEREPALRPASALVALDRLGGRHRGRTVDLLPHDLPAERVADADALRPIFRGPDLFLHLQEDAAAALWARTGGQPGAVGEELAAWVRAGLAWQDGAALVIERPALAQLEAGLIVGLGADQVGALSQPAAELLRWVRLAWPDAAPEVLAVVSGMAPALVADGLDELRLAGLVWDLPGGRLGTRPGGVFTDEQGESWLREAHHRLAQALPKPSEARLRHLIRSGLPPAELFPELRALAHQLLTAGRLSRALAVVELGLPLSRRPGVSREDEDALLKLVALSALAQEDEASLDRALYDLGRASGGGELRESLMMVVQGFRAATRGEPDRALALLDALAPFEDDDLEIWCQGIRTKAASRQGVAAEGALLDRLEGWVREGGPQRRAKLAGWRANWLYRQGRFVEAAALHQESALGKLHQDAQLAALVNASGYSLYALQFDAAQQIAEQVVKRAVELRHAKYEALGVWTLRALAYRQGRPLPADAGLVEAVAYLGHYLEALFAMNEAAASWRQGAVDQAESLARRATSAFARRGQHEPATLCESLAMAVRGGYPPDQLRGLAASAQAFRVSALAVQTLGLLRIATSQPDPDWLERAWILAGCRPESEWSLCLDILSFDEALGRVRKMN